jgi:concentrative nucleoside transporter, CNT family
MADIEKNRAPSPVGATDRPSTPLENEKKVDHTSSSSIHSAEKGGPIGDHHVVAERDAEIAEARRERRHSIYARFRPFILTGVALVILGWWISATVLPATRPRWYV